MKIRKDIKKSTEKLVRQNSQDSRGSKVSRENENTKKHKKINRKIG